MLKRIISFVVVAVVLVSLAGCQVDLQGPSISAKVFRKQENNNMVYLSRGSGMAGGTSYAAAGGLITADGRPAQSWQWGTTEDATPNGK